MRANPIATRRQLLSASGLAMATALLAGSPAAHAQSFQGTPTSTFGSVTISTGSGTTDVVVSSPSAVINWTPTDTAPTGGPIAFQTAGTTATFTNNISGNSDFAVLNRIIPSGSTRPIQFDGTVVSRLQSAVAGPTPGGTVFFYSPGGILIGASSVFDVGNLVLTTSDLNYSTVDGSFDTSGSYVFQPASVAGSQIVVSVGAQLGATTDGSYIAMIAPSVTNNGAINVNGSAALVAADAATITFSPSGLFDIQVDSGTSATGSVLINNGSVAGPAASSPTFLHRVYMVAVPKNSAITMAIGAGSSLGFDIAGAADVSGNSIILSAGQDVVGGNAQVAPSAGGGSELAGITGGDADFTSNLVSRSTGSFTLNSASSAGLDFASNVFISSSQGDAGIGVNPGGVVNFAANAELYADHSSSNPTLSAQGGSAQLAADGSGVMTVVGDVHLSGNGYGASAVSPGANGSDGVGGFATMLANNGGRITVSGDVQLDAIGFGGQAPVAGTGAGSGTGGTAGIAAIGTGGSAVNILGAASLDATGRGYDGNGCVTCTLDGGSAQGGQAVYSVNGDSTLSVGLGSLVVARAFSGSSTTGAGGTASGGQISVTTANTASMTLGAFSAFAGASAGGGATLGGLAQGGDISFATNSTSGPGIGIGGAALFDSSTFGSSGTGAGGINGASRGGTVNILANTTGITVSGNFSALANGFGGSAVAGTSVATGGTVAVEARNGGALTVVNDITVTANATGAFATGPIVAGNAFGGDTDLFANGGTILANSVFITSNGTGGGQAGSGVAGNGFGGLAQMHVATGGLISTVNGVSIASTGRGGVASASNATGGAGTGGTALIDTTGGQVSVGSTFSFVAEGYGGEGTTAGNGGGGTVTASIVDTTFAINGISYIGAIGSGGSSLSTTVPGSAGTATGGSISFGANRSTVHLSQTGNVTFEATGFAGIGQTPANGTGGSIALSAESSTVDASSAINLFAEGSGGVGYNGGPGGNGFGGTVTVNALAARTAPTIILTSDISISTVGRGGDGDAARFVGNSGGNGGAGQGGTINLNTAVDSDSVAALSSFTANASGVGGNGALGAANSPNGDRGGDGGAAVGGQINVTSLAASGGISAFGGYDIGVGVFRAGASGGAGGDGGAGLTQGAGGNGGAATAGAITMSFDQGGSRLSATDGVSVLADATGGNSGVCGIACTASGGVAQGGTISFGSAGNTTGNLIGISGGLTLSALGIGGSSYGAAGANGTGGVVIASLGSGLSFSADQVSVVASGLGGDQFTTLSGGDGVGGNASFIASGTSTTTISGNASLFSNGTGGDGNGDGGVGRGGISRLYSDGGAISVIGGATISASGFGGAGNLNGNSGTGGAGTGGQALLTVGTPTAIGNNGNINVGGITFVHAVGVGGDSSQGGVGTGGFVGISARQGVLTLNQVDASTNGFGGFGQFGGTGGAAAGGSAAASGGVEVIADSAIEGPSQITINTLTAESSGFGGSGGLAATPTGNGGIGGNGDGGDVLILGLAGNGRLQITSVSANASGNGGSGGDGLNGGAGGVGSGGGIQIGVSSGRDTGALNAGSATFGTILTVATGSGGIGGTGDASFGTGGAGGNAAAGGSTLLVRGAPVTITGTGSFNAHGVGGIGGSGATLGVGGSATVGNTVGTNVVAGAALVVTNRFQQPAQRGSLTAGGDLDFSAIALGGTGSVAGTGTIIGDAIDMELINGSFTGTSASFSAVADSAAPGAFPAFISLTNSALDLSGNLQFSTPGTFSLLLDQSTLRANTVAISADNWVLPATAPASLGTLTGTSAINLSSDQDIVGYADLSTQGSLTITALGRIDLGSLFALGAINVTASGSLTLDDVTSNASVDLISQAGSVTTGNVNAVGRVGVTASGNLTLGNLREQSDRLELISSNGAIAAGQLISGSDILANGRTGVSVGLVRGRDIALLSNGNVSAQTVLAGIIVNQATGQITNATGRLLIANSSMLPATSSLPGSIDYNALFTATPVRTGGNVNVTNAVIAGRVAAASGGNLTIAGMRSFSTIDVESGGLVTVGQRWFANEIHIVSSDIAIIDNGSVNNPATGQTIVSGLRTVETGFIDLISNSASTALVGDGLTGSGYALGNAELGLVSTGTLTIAAVDQSANATDMLIGNLSLTAGGAIGSTNAVGPAGKIIFASGSLQTQTPGGAIRVVGTINGTGFAQSNILEFTTGRFELDAATGAINLTSASQSSATAPLGGVLEINAANIHVAAASILDKLAANPLYDGRIAELNLPARVQRPEGVIRALGLDLFPTGTLYIQNTGTFLNPAGFFADIDLTDVTAPSNATPGSISIVVNGAFQTPTGVASGSAAHDLVIDEPDANFASFTADSQINGCLLTAAVCATVIEGPDPIGAISSQIEIVSNETLGNTPTFIEDPGAPTADAESDDPAQDEQQQEQQASESEDAASSPIAPPPQLIDSKQLEPQTKVEQPVAGSGNPALIGSVVNESSAEGDAQ